ncbi:MAG: MBG domain-containing protein [Clostridiales bacterium]|jgi:hypothetical protein|nr:MBG domain-containing protein [Clostridiales bacterium]
MKAKKLVSLLLCFVMAISTLTACEPEALTALEFEFNGETAGKITYGYSGAPKDFDLSFADGALDASGITYSVTYSAQDGQALSQQPLDAGDYTVKAEITAAGFVGSHTATLQITKKPVAITADDINAYVGATPVHEYTIAGGLEFTVDITYGEANTAAVPSVPGEYTVTYSINDKNHSGTAVAVLTLGARLGLASISLPSNLYYDGAPKTATVNIQSAFQEIVSVTYTGADGTSYAESVTAPVNAGTYTVTARLLTDGVPESLSRTFTLAKSVVNVTAQNINVTPGSAIVHDVAFDVDGAPSYSVSYTDAEQNIIAEPTAVGVYGVRYEITDGNYSGGATAVLTISARSGELSLSGLNATYDGNEHAAGIAGLKSYHEVLAVEYNSNGGEYASAAPVNAGTYGARALVRTDNAVTETLTGTLTIAKRTSGITASDINIKVGGGIVADYTVSGGYKPHVDVVFLSADGQTTLGAEPSEAGTYKIKYIINDPNYSSAEVTVSLTISARLDEVTVSGGTYTFDGAAKEVTVSGMSEYHTGLTLTYAKRGELEPLAGLPINAGVYDVTAAFLTDGVPETLTAEITIKPMALNITLQSKSFEVAATFTHDISVAEDVTLTAYTVSYADKNDTEAQPSETVPALAGEYTVTLTVTEPNYSGAATATYTVLARLGRLSISGLNQTYDGTARAVTVTGGQPYHGNIAVTYKKGDAVLDGAPVDAGSYKVILTATADGAADVYQEQTLTVGKRNIQISADAATAYKGDSFDITYSPAEYARRAFGVTVTYAPKDGGDASSVKPSAVGEYTVTVTIDDGNLTGTATTLLTVIPNTDRLSFTGLTTQYANSAKTVGVVGLTENLTLDSLIYEGVDGTVYAAAANAPSGVGKYKVTITVKDFGEPVEIVKTLIINKANVTIGSYKHYYTVVEGIAQAPVRPEAFAVFKAEDIIFTYGESDNPALPGRHAFAVTASDSVTVDKTSGEMLVTFATALQAFEYGKNYFENVATDLKTVYVGTATPSTGSKQYTYTERFKSGNSASEVDFYYRTANGAAKTLFIDSRVGVQSHVKSGQYFYRSGTTGIPEGPGDADGFVPLNLTGAFTQTTQAGYKTKWGVLHDGLSGYIINASTITTGATAAVTLGENDLYAYTFDLNSGSHADYKKQVTAFSGQSYNSFTSLRLKLVADIYGRIIEIEVLDKYSVTALKVNIVAEGKERIAYDTYDQVVYENMVRGVTHEKW